MPTVLVTYASRAGSTQGVAEAIGRTLESAGAAVHVLPMADVTDLSAYDAVVAGSAIRSNIWLPEAMQFVEKHQAALARKPFAAFMVCITLAMKSADRYRAGVIEWMQPVRDLVRPVAEGHFAGALDFSKLPLFPEGITMRVPVLLGLFPKGDHRDWDAIDAWATTLIPLLGIASPQKTAQAAA